LRRVASSRAAAPLLLALTSVALPLALLDFGLRPFLEPKTTLFREDPTLGWRLVPGAVGEWGGVRITVNSQGLRGPEVAHARTPGALRVLHLGDSVAFGYGLARFSDAAPFAADAALERALQRPVETVNASVGGWSPWQQHLYLVGEGFAWAPDLVVVHFVLNDVTEKLALHRYGGSERGWQLARSARSSLDRWLSGSAVWTALRGGYARLRFGPDVAAGALAAEEAAVRRLVREPGDPQVSRGWRIAFANLEKIVAACRERDVPLVLVVHPYAFQLAAPDASHGPQRALGRFAAERRVPLLDLLPVLSGCDDCFLDASHLSVKGARLVGEALAGFVVERDLLGGPSAS
jgi:lysophospholipase L1-like esterase